MLKRILDFIVKYQAIIVPIILKLISLIKRNTDTSMQLNKYFKLREFKCKDGTDVPDELIPKIQILADQLLILREYWGLPIKIISGYRTASYNKSVGGARNSFHTKGKAADIRVAAKQPKEVYDAIERLIKDGKMREGGLGLYDNFVHYDYRGRKTRKKSPQHEWMSL